METKQQVHPSDIEKALVKIWDSHQGKNKMRACLFNLIIYAKNDSRRSYYESVAKRVVKRFPCRIIFITEQLSDNKTPLKSYVSVMSADEGKDAIFCDLIQVEIPNQESKKAPFLVLPHILPDLPIYVVWGSNPKDNPDFLAMLEEMASKTVFDSETAPCLREFTQMVFEQREKTEGDIIDLNWARIEGWRNLFAATFYCEEKLKMLHSAHKIEIIYNEMESDQFTQRTIQSIYLQGWMAASLGWKLTSQKEGEWIYEKGDGKEVTIVMKQGEQSNVKPGRVLAVNIESDTGEAYHFKRLESSPCIIDIKYSTPTYCETPAQYLFNQEQSGQSLAGEIFHRGTSKHFLKTLEFLSQ